VTESVAVDVIDGVADGDTVGVVVGVGVCVAIAFDNRKATITITGMI
jgi:hypothetical protein